MLPLEVSHLFCLVASHLVLINPVILIKILKSIQLHIVTKVLESKFQRIKLIFEREMSRNCFLELLAVEDSNCLDVLSCPFLYNLHFMCGVDFI